MAPRSRPHFKSVLAELKQALADKTSTPTVADAELLGRPADAREPAPTLRATLPSPASQAPTKLDRKPAIKSQPRDKKKVSKLRPTGAWSVPARGAPIDFGDTRKKEPKREPVPVEPAMLKGADALRYVKQHVSSAQIRVAPGPPPKASSTTYGRVARMVASGQEVLRDCPVPDPRGFVVGFDFGTSSSKIVIHQLGAGDFAYALPVPKELQATDQDRSQDHLWRSIVWFDPKTERFSLAPRAGWIAVEGFKTGLIQSYGHRMETAAITHGQASTAYLALLIAYVLGHHREVAPEGFDRTAHYGRFHFGVPVACKDEPGCVREFRRVFGAAFNAAAYASELDLAIVQRALGEAAPNRPETSETPFLVFEELAAVIAGYRASPERRFGPHMVVDVGASTLDVATFYVPNGDHPVDVYMSGVELLGAEALAAARRASVPAATFEAACGAHTTHVWSNTFLKKNASFFPNNGVPKPLLFVGGGRLTPVHARLYKKYQKGLEAPLRTPRPGSNLSFNGSTDVERLLLAWGLSQDAIDIPELRPPSQVEAEVRRERDYTSRFVDKDMV